LKEYVPDARKSEPLVHVLRSARSILEPDLPDSTLVAAALDDEHLKIMRELQFRSVMIVPLLTLERTLGALTLMSGASGRRFDEADLAIAEDLAKRAALAINNAALYRESRETAEKLRRANAAKDEFLGLVSHELKTPITTILGNAELLEKRAGLLDEESQAEALADVRTDAERLNRVIDNLLVLARIEAGEEIAAEPLSLLPLSKRICDEHARRHEGRDIVLRAEHAPVLVSAHHDHVELVLRNLLSNAEKYSCRTMPIELEVSSGSDLVSVSVLDRGVGIPHEEVGAVFTAFYRSSRTPADKPGFGIGLAVCKRLIEAQGGEIWARRRDGGGSEFGFSLPAYAEAT
jgi:signal transduction histidine kinase